MGRKGDGKLNKARMHDNPEDNSSDEAANTWGGDTASTAHNSAWPRPCKKMANEELAGVPQELPEISGLLASEKSDAYESSSFNFSEADSVHTPENNELLYEKLSVCNSSSVVDTANNDSMDKLKALRRSRVRQATVQKLFKEKKACWDFITAAKRRSKNSVSMSMPDAYQEKRRITGANGEQGYAKAISGPETPGPLDGDSPIQWPVNAAERPKKYYPKKWLISKPVNTAVKAGGPFNIFMETVRYTDKKRDAYYNRTLKLLFLWQKEKNKDTYKRRYLEQFKTSPGPEFRMEYIKESEARPTKMIKKSPYLLWMLAYLRDSATDDLLAKDSMDIALELAQIWSSMDMRSREPWTEKVDKCRENRMPKKEGKVKAPEWAYAKFH